MLSVKGVTTVVFCDFGITLDCVIIDNLKVDLIMRTDFLAAGTERKKKSKKLPG